MDNNLGLSDQQLAGLRKVFAEHKKVEQVKVYGSRAKGNFTDRSDIDLVVFGDELTRHDVSAIKLDIDESDIPFLVDVTLYHDIKNYKLIDHIDRVAVVIFTR